MSSGGKYVPPSRRAGYNPTATSLPPSHKTGRIRAPNQYFVHELSKHFTHPQDSSITFFSTHAPVSRPRSDPTRALQDTPLPASPPPPHPLGHLVSYIVIFPDAHPAWESESELWTHINADKLIEDWEGGKKNFGRPVPVFDTNKESRDLVSSQGCWCIDNLEIVEPQSDELKRILQLKEQSKSYSRGGRSREAWQNSLNQRWIKMRLSPAAESTENYAELVDVMSLKGGEGGEVERYLLDVGGLKKEVDSV